MCDEPCAHCSQPSRGGFKVVCLNGSAWTSVAFVCGGRVQIGVLILFLSISKLSNFLFCHSS
jgi:hypothetical protein